MLKKEIHMNTLEQLHKRWRKHTGTYDKRKRFSYIRRTTYEFSIEQAGTAGSHYRKYENSAQRSL